MPSININNHEIKMKIAALTHLVDHTFDRAARGQRALVERTHAAETPGAVDADVAVRHQEPPQGARLGQVGRLGARRGRAEYADAERS